MARKTTAIVIFISYNPSYGLLLTGMRSDKCWSDGSGLVADLDWKAFL